MKISRPKGKTKKKRGGDNTVSPAGVFFFFCFDTQGLLSDPLSDPEKRQMLPFSFHAGIMEAFISFPFSGFPCSAIDDNSTSMTPSLFFFPASLPALPATQRLPGFVRHDCA